MESKVEHSKSKVKFATVWLDGCSGCHMSFLDMDERLIALADRIDLVYSPLVDIKIFPPQVDVTLVEGSVSTVEDIAKIRHIRECTKVLVALGDCAITGNVPAMRNPFDLDEVCDRAYKQNVDLRAGTPTAHLPALLERVRPVHDVVDVDLFIPGCPPPADAIYQILTDVLEGRTPAVSELTHFGR